MKDFIDELKYMCSESNQKSRGLYIFITIMLVLLTIGVVASAVLLVVNLIKGYTAPIFFILFFGVLAVWIGLIVWLKKS